MAYGYSLYASCPSIRIAALGIDIGADDFCGFMMSDPATLAETGASGTSARCPNAVMWSSSAIPSPASISSSG